MKQPVDIEWPLAGNMRWFEGKSTKDILELDEKKFKDQMKQNVLKIVVKTNRSFQEKVDAWQYMRPQKDLFGTFFKAIIRLALSQPSEFNLTNGDRYQLLTFFNYSFNSIEIDFVHEQIKKLLPLSIWINLSQKKRNQELSKLSKRIQVAWDKLERQDKRMDPDNLKERIFERKFIFNYMRQFLGILSTAVLDSKQDTKMETDSPDEGNNSPDIHEIDNLNRDVALYCQRFIEFIIDIESQLPLRRFFHALMEDIQLIVRCQLSDLARHKSAEGQLFNQLVELLLLYSRYEIDIMSGDPLSDVEVLRKHEQNILNLQKILWSKYEHLKKLAIKPVRAIDNPAALYKIVTSFDSKEELFELLRTVGLVDEENMTEKDRDNAPLMASIFMNYYRRYDSQMKKINSIPLFPNESVIWDTNLVPDQYYNYEYPLALPKLNLQFLTMSDYLLRNFMLFKNESTYEIRQDIEDGIFRSKCRWTGEGNFATGPKQRMALIIKKFSIIEVGKPRLGEQCPSKVRAKVVLNMDFVRPEWRREWEQLRKHDTCFLVSFRKPDEKDDLGWPEGTFPAKNFVKYVRGCEIEGLLDSEGKIVDENLETPKFSNNIRTYHVLMDCNQYQIDQDALVERKLVVYDKFHLMVRRKPEKNNFKGVLETIRNLINTKFVVPDWLKNLLIGFGDPYEASPDSLRDADETIELDYFDTFVDYDHLKTSFKVLKPDYNIVLENCDRKSSVPPFKVKINDTDKVITVIPYEIPSRGPYPSAVPKKNSLKFTPAQVGAISSGLQNGLTMVVGPPGTGKTDVAVQILSTLYHSNPNQRTLIVTHSNQALNQIFGKMIELDVQEHHLLRMGHGEEDLDSNQDFSRQGRVKHVLRKRLELLVHANRLARSMGLSQGDGLSCQSSEYFYSYHIEPRWNSYQKMILNDQIKLEDIAEKFPFKKYFDDAPQPLFKGKSHEEDIEIAHSCFRYIEDLFKQLACFRPFEIFQNASDRSKYLLIREAKIIAMTCTHAGLRRKELVEMNFQYDNILMEETAQILEIETTIPLLLQNPENGVNRLKRWIMIGDHNQLPPIIQNSAFQKFSNMEQSLFARFIRLGVPHIQLDAQGRARPSLCDLYRWRYTNLRELDIIHINREFERANCGFLHEYQLINVGDYKGCGESAPMPYYYQNRGEAEYVVAVYRFMRFIGYPSEKITILTTYNGQKQLLRDLIEQECSKDESLGRPSKVTTVDKFQGQQNDYILLSLVRTRTVGHLRDIRRLVVAMSRARLGLYVFARVNLFSTSIELRPAMKLLLKKPTDLHLLVGETYPTDRIATCLKEQNQLIGDGDSNQDIRTRIIRSVDDMQQLVATLQTNSMEEQARSPCEMTNTSDE
jgi:intron-binding protein aquarius